MIFSIIPFSIMTLKAMDLIMTLSKTDLIVTCNIMAFSKTAINVIIYLIATLRELHAA